MRYTALLKNLPSNTSCSAHLHRFFIIIMNWQVKMWRRNCCVDLFIPRKVLHRRGFTHQMQLVCMLRALSDLLRHIRLRRKLPFRSRYLNGEWIDGGWNGWMNGGWNGEDGASRNASSHDFVIFVEDYPGKISHICNTLNMASKNIKLSMLIFTKTRWKLNKVQWWA